jgi:predicted GNAT family acetyltransferase
MTTPSPAESWHPMHQELQFSDYSEWLDEGTEALVHNIAQRARAQKTESRPVRGSDYELDITHDADLAVYRAWINSDEVAILTYKVVGHRFVLLSTSVVPGFRRHGIATELIAHVLDDVRESGRTVTVICPAVREFMDHYPQYEDLLDKNRPGVRSRADVG